jgi:hypothetical protein
VTLKQEVIKLPKFYGQPEKDSISALDFISRIDECQISNDWNDVTSFSNFRLVLRGQAEKWIASIVCHLQLTAAQKTWTRIRPLFKKEFAMVSDDKLIIDSLAKLSHWPNENPRMFFSRQEELLHVLKESYASYRIKPQRPAQQPQPQGGFSEDDLTKVGNDNIDFFTNFLFTQMFGATAPKNNCRLISHKDQSRLTVDDAYQIFFTKHLVEIDKKTAPIHAVSEEQDTASQDRRAAFWPQQKQQPCNSQQNFNNGGNRSRGQGFSRGNFNNRQSNPTQVGSNTARNGKFCIYCKILSNTQQECRKPIRDNKPCVNKKG